MKSSILKMLESKGHFFSKYDINVIDKIDKFLMNKLLDIELSQKGICRIRKNGFKYNMKLTLYKDEKRWFIDDTRYINIGNEGLEFIEKMIRTFLNGTEKKWEDNLYKSNTKMKSFLDDDNFSIYPNRDNDDDDISESTIIRDLERGEGYKHGLE